MAEFQIISDSDLVKATLFNRSRLAENGCWEWQRGGRAGYGQMQYKKKTEGAHRVSYQVYHGTIPHGMVVRHMCDNPSCVNPDHLLIGTVADNVADREIRRRRQPRVGEEVGNSKLTTADVKYILSSSEKGCVLARRFNVSDAHISRIRRGLVWPHLQRSSHQQGV